MTNQPASSNQSPQELALQALIMDPDFERLEDLLAEFNLFDVLGIQRRELQHSAFLAWLLNPKESHGLRDYFLRHFLLYAAAAGRGDLTPIDVDRWKLTDMDIQVVTERHNIDILIVDTDDEFVCLIENKVGAAEHDDQLSRYLETVETEYGGLTALPIFLTPDGIEPASESDAERWIPLGYDKVFYMIEHVLKMRGSTISASVASFLEQYKRSLGRYVLQSSDNIDELALQIYNKHRTAIDHIVSAMPARQAVGWRNIDEAIEQYAPDLRRDYDSKSYHRFFVPGLEDIPALKQGAGWTASQRILLFEARYPNRAFALVIGPGPQDTRNRLYELLRGVQSASIRTRPKLAGTWHAIYSKRLIPSGASYDLNSDQATPHIERAIKEFYENDYWPIVNAIREEFGLPVIPSTD